MSAFVHLDNLVDFGDTRRWHLIAIIERRSWKHLLSHVAEEIENLGVTGLVVGLPLNMDGSEGRAASGRKHVGSERGQRSIGCAYTAVADGLRIVKTKNST